MWGWCWKYMTENQELGYENKISFRAIVKCEWSLTLLTSKSSQTRLIIQAYLLLSNCTYEWSVGWVQHWDPCSHLAGTLQAKRPCRYACTGFPRCHERVSVFSINQIVNSRVMIAQNSVNVNSLSQINLNNIYSYYRSDYKSGWCRGLRCQCQLAAIGEIFYCIWTQFSVESDRIGSVGMRFPVAGNLSP